LMAVPVGCWPNANAANSSRPRAFFFFLPRLFFWTGPMPGAPCGPARPGARPGATPCGPSPSHMIRPHAPPCGPMQHATPCAAPLPSCACAAPYPCPYGPIPHSPCAMRHHAPCAMRLPPPPAPSWGPAGPRSKALFLVRSALCAVSWGLSGPSAPPPPPRARARGGGSM
jgi:hypothetical protein